MIVRIATCATTLVLLSSGLAGAGTIASGSVRVDPLDGVQCIVPNVGDGTIRQIDVDITFSRSDGTFSSGASTECPDVAAGDVCTDNSFGTSGDFSMFCTVRFSNGKVRGTLCNLTKGLCTDLR